MIDIKEILKKKEIQNIIKAPDFYFQKGQDALKKWVDLKVSDSLKERLIQLSNEYEEFQAAALKSPEIKNILDLLFEIIAYCDSKARDKKLFNKYDDKRVLANAAVRMNDWIAKLITLKFKDKDLTSGSPKNAFDYLLDPDNHATILSENHRQLVSENLINKKFGSSEFVKDLKDYFKQYNLKTENPKNYTHLLSWIIYSIEDKWKEEVVALMASDGTGWQDEHIDGMDGFDASIVWNTKRPSGTGTTLTFLRNIIEDGGSFNLYYSSRGMVNYKATVIDFAENQEQLDEKQWNRKLKISHFEKKFNDYSNENKSASIIFLCKSFEKIRPIPVSEFLFYSGYDSPRQDNISPIKLEPVGLETLPAAFVPNESNMRSGVPLNQILFGPPGTGKTYHTINKALEIIGESIEGKSRQETKALFDSKMKEGQIVFTTFHQSMSYEDFIEGIKPIEPEKDGDPVIYRVEYGLFRNLCIEASFAIAQLRETKTTEEVLDFSILYDRFAEGVEERILNGQKVELETKSGGTVMVESISQQGNFIIKHHDGTRTYTVSKVRLTKLQSVIRNLDEVSNINDQFREIIGGSNSSAYWSVLNAIKKEKYTTTTNKENRVYTFDDKKEVVLSLSKSDYKNKSGKPFVLIIDEINRGNVSQIFGELITLVETDKRLGNNEGLELTLPYSKDKFGVPPNLFIVGTMNTADRSVEALDTALRRRFSFEEMPPRYDLPELNYEYAGIKAFEILGTINKRIEKLVDKDHAIGHSYFILRDDEVADQKIITSFYKSIIPLLQEYFFGDYGKIGLVLGKGFVRKKEWDKNSDSFADFDAESASDFEDREVYEIIDYRNLKSEYTILIKDKMVVMDFPKAIRLLMKQDIE